MLLRALPLLLACAFGLPILADVRVGKIHIRDGVREKSGEVVHAVTSPYQAGTTEIRVVLPDAYEGGDTSRRFRVVYVLPVVAGKARQWGDGLDEVRKHDLANRHGVICVAPTFSHLPWYADHPEDDSIRQESYLLRVVVPYLEQAYRTQRGRRGRLLVGFSKSGWGAFSLLLRNPRFFERAVAWDAPFRLDAPGKYGSGPIFGSKKNFERYDVSSLAKKHAPRFEDPNRLIVLGYDNFRRDHQELHSLLEKHEIPHVYRDGPKRKHHWSTGWLPEAFEAVTKSLPQELDAVEIDPSSLHVVIVGVLEWKDAKVTQYSKEKRQDLVLRDTLLARGVPKEQITVVLDREATLEHITNAVGETAAKVPQDGSLLFYYAGHGFPSKKPNEYCYLNWEGDGSKPETCLTTTRLTKILREKLSGSTLLLTADCCYSGGLGEVARAIASPKRRAVCIASASDKCVSTSNWTFTQALIDGIRGDRLVDHDLDGLITAKELGHEVANVMLLFEGQDAGYTRAGGTRPIVLSRTPSLEIDADPPITEGFGLFVRTPATGRQGLGRIVGRSGPGFLVRQQRHNTRPIIETRAEGLTPVRLPKRLSDQEALRKASLGRKYTKLLRKIQVASDYPSYGAFRDYGFYQATDWKGHRNLPAGHWVYVYPHWYIWDVSKAAKIDPKEAIDEYLETCHERGAFNGVVLGATKGKIDYFRALGVETIDGEKRLSTDSVFRLASVSKAFTAMAILILEEKGALSLDDDVRKHLPGLPYEGVTIRHLVHHTSGLPDYVSLLEAKWDLEGKKNGARKIATSPDALALLREHQPERRFAPGEKYQYSNTGYILLGLVVEKVSGMKFGEFFRAKIFAPLGMKRTVLFTPKTPPKIENRAYGFRYGVDGLTRIPNDEHFLNGMYGDGEVYSCAEDLLLWDRALYSEKLVPRAAIERAFTPGKLEDGSPTSYGYGWVIQKRGTRRLVVHGGGWVGFRTWIERDLTNERVLIVLTNDTSGHFGKIRKDVAALLEGKTAKPPREFASRALARCIARKPEAPERAADAMLQQATEQPDLWNRSELRLERLRDDYRERGESAKADAAHRVLEALYSTNSSE